MKSIDINLTASIISIIAGLMTIIGISGIVSWSIFSKDRGSLEDRVMSIFAFSLKSALNLIIFLALFALAQFPYVFILLLSKDSLSSSNFYWDVEHPVAHIIAYSFISIIFIPIYLVLCLCVYRWSLTPIKKLKDAKHSCRNRVDYLPVWVKQKSSN